MHCVRTVLLMINVGTITTAGLRQIQNQYFNGDKNELMKELSSMIPDTKKCEERKKSINILAELEKFQKGAQVMMSMREIFKFQGNFSHLQLVFQTVQHQYPLSFIYCLLLSASTNVHVGRCSLDNDNVARVR